MLLIRIQTTRAGRSHRDTIPDPYVGNKIDVLDYSRMITRDPEVRRDRLEERSRENNQNLIYSRMNFRGALNVHRSADEFIDHPANHMRREKRRLQRPSEGAPVASNVSSSQPS